ncbi:hypothetical protein WIS52_20440 [Pseudonocardia nematodicida]|uniref:Phthiocerol/phthiodiolone dimycocerosyl transferase n=1 Tax=Pseudonocardia nematodicida TaxID=1206997 RepID=A0ABV1KHM2_9PSEU
MTTRALSPLERWYDVADRISPLNVTGRLTVHGRVDVAALRRGLNAMQCIHPLARVAVAGDGPGRRFVSTATPIPLRVVTAADPDEIVARELTERVDAGTGPLLRATAVPAADGTTTDLVLSVSHRVADGTTLLSLLHDWVECAAGIAPPPRAGLPPTEELFPTLTQGLAGEAAADRKARDDRADLARYRPGRVVADRVVSHSDRRTGLVRREITGTQLATLVAACRAVGVSVHGLLGAVLARVVGRESAAGWVTLGSPIDFRAELDPPVDRHEMGSFVATLPTLVDTTQDPWAAAAAVSTDLTARRGRGEHFSMITALGRAAPATPEEAGPFLDDLDRNGPINLCLTNLGVCGVPDRIGPWPVTGAQFAAGISVVGLLVAAVTTHGGVLSVNLTYVLGAVGTARVTRLADEWLAEVALLVAGVVRTDGEPSGAAR